MSAAAVGPASVAARALACLDLTNLEADCDAAAVAALCQRAMTPHGPVAAVCIWPAFVAGAKAALAGTPVRVATVVNFPAGTAPVAAVEAETAAALADGADEIDLVVPWPAVAAGRPEAVTEMVAAIRAVSAGATLKTILETGELADPALIRVAAEAALAGGTDFLKTSTGKVKVNATPAAALILLEAIRASGRDDVGLKPAGGVRTTVDAGVYLGLCDAIMGPGWATPARFRIGASSVLTALLATLDGARGKAGRDGDAGGIGRLLMLPQEVIVRKRDGGTLPAEAIRDFIAGLTAGTVGEGQVAAFAMAVLFRGMDRGERVALTEAMRDSGTVMAWDLPGPVVDKHSTGGVGDTVSLMLAPALAACGAYVPMISGRGLGHTGGTLDKFDAIPGYVTQPDAETFRRVVAEVGCAIIGQTDDIAPADRRLYAIRDVTGTVESIDLITASILSKKLAAGLGGLVLDVKVGTGAFMATLDDARALARALVDVAKGAGCPTVALITDMNEPLATAAGNALEVAAAARFLRGDVIDGRLWDVTVALGGEALALGGLAGSPEEGAERIAAAFASGRAAERFDRMVAALGGPTDFLDRFESHLPGAPEIVDVIAGREGFIAAIDTRGLGLAVVELGGGRLRASDPVDHAVGLETLIGLGASVDADTPLARIHAADRDALALAEARVRAAYHIAETVPEVGPLVVERIA